LVFKNLQNSEELSEVSEKSRVKIGNILEDLDKFLKISRQSRL